MKNIFKKTLAAFLVVLMLLSAAPLQVFVGLDISSLFASEASAAVATSSRKIGTFQDYDTTIVVITNGDSSYEYVSKVIIDGKEYSINDEDLLSLDTAESFMNNKVIFTAENNVIVSISRFYVKNTEISISGNNTSISYKDGWFSKKKFSLTGNIYNSLTRADSYDSEIISNYYNTNGINQLEDIYITLKSPNKDILYFDKGIFNGKESELTFPLDRTIGAGFSDSFDCDIYVNRDYYPPSGSEDITIECILNGYLNGVKVEGVYSSFVVSITNEDFYKKGETKEISLREFLELIQGDINRCNLLKSGEKVELSLKFTSALGWDSFVKFDDTIGMIEVAYDMAGDLSGVGFKSVESTGKLYLETIIEDITSEMEDIEDFAKGQLYELLNHEYFKIYISWYEAQLQQGNQSLALYNIQCPTDVIVTDIDGNIVLEIINNEIVTCDSYIYAFVVDDEKYVYLPTDIEHNIEIIATDNGTMDYSVSMYTPSGTERIIAYNDVPLVKDEAYTALAPCKSMLPADTFNLITESGEEIEYDSDTLPPVEDNIVDVIVAEELFDGFPVEIIDLVADAMFNMKSVVDLSAYDISTDDAVALFSAIAKYYPTEYSLIANGDFTYKIIVSPNLDRIMKIRFYYGDDANLSTYQKRVKDLNAEIDALVAQVEGMNEFEKALYIHDYIVLNCEYDLELLDILETEGTLTGELRSEKYTEYSVLVNGTGICGSYALAYRAILNAAGMDCLYLSSAQMNHAWNLVKIDGNWYHVDCCWDDPVPDTYGRAGRTYFLRTDKEIMELRHYSWTPGQYKATSEKYSDMPRNYDIKQKYDDGKWYYLTGSTLYSSDEYGKNETEITSISASSIDADNGNVYYSNGRYIYEYDMTTSEKNLVYMLSSKDSGEKPITAYLSNIYVDDENIDFYKSIYEDDKQITVFDTDLLQREKFAAITGIKISQSEVSLDVFKTMQLTAKIITTGSVENLEIEWISSDDSVAKVDSNGNITAVNVGVVTITAQVFDFASSCTLTVTGDGLSGMCGDKVKWSFEPYSGLLTLSGKGKMEEYTSRSDSHWYDFREEIKSVLIEEDVTNIGSYAFYDCANLLDVNISGSVTTISSYAFWFCKKLTNITIPNSVTSIGSNAFSSCDSLTNIVIPNSVTSIGSNAFSSCDSLANISVAENNPNYSSDENGVLFNKEKTELILYPRGNKTTSYVIPDSVITICEDAISYCDNLESITISNSVTNIGSSAFSDCDNLTSITIPDSVTIIGSHAFRYCNHLKNVTIGKNVTSINIQVFDDCNSLECIVVDKNNSNYCSDEDGVLFNKEKTELIQYPNGNARSNYKIPDCVTSIGEYAFNCNKLIDIVISDSVVSISSNSFRYCRSLKNVTIGNSLTGINARFFRGCQDLEYIIVDKNNLSYCNDENGVLFNKEKTELVLYPRGNVRTSYTIPGTVTTIGEYAFEACENLTKVIIPNGVTNIGSHAFTQCGRLSTINIPNGVTSISSSAFSYCEGLINVTLPMNVTKIGSYAFNHCSSLANIIIPDSVTYIDIGAFQACNKLMHVGYVGSEEDFSKIQIFVLANSKLEKAYHHYNFNPTADFVTVDNKSATCTENGNTIMHYCVDCDYYFDGEVIPATGHSYSITESVEGTCVSAPYDVYTCSSCGDSYTKTGTIDDGHKYVETIISPTCTEKGYTTATCSECEETVIYDFTSPLGHEFVINRSENYCETHGTVEYSCKNCDYHEKLVSDETMLVTETVTVEPTCTKSGTSSEICTLCGATVSTQILNPLSHNYAEEYTVDVEATCTTDGRKSQHCTRCDAKRAVTVIEATGHQNTAVINVIEAACNKNGYTGDVFCYDCNSVIENGVSTDMLAHRHSAVITAPTCTSKGFTTHTCSECGDTYTDSETDMLNHSYNSVATPVSCTANGYTTYTCSVCSHSYTDNIIAATGHKYADNGICSECGDNRTAKCDHLCHKSGFMGFIWKIVKFFWSLFKMNPVCGCGAAHY